MGQLLLGQWNTASSLTLQPACDKGVFSAHIWFVQFEWALSKRRAQVNIINGVGYKLRFADDVLMMGKTMLLPQFPFTSPVCSSTVIAKSTPYAPKRHVPITIAKVHPNLFCQKLSTNLSWQSIMVCWRQRTRHRPNCCNQMSPKPPPTPKPVLFFWLAVFQTLFNVSENHICKRLI